MDITDSQARAHLARQASDLRRARQKAGRALSDRAAVEADLNDACDFFADSDWSDATLDDLITASGRIGRLATLLRNADRVPAALERAQTAKARVDALKEN